MSGGMRKFVDLTNAIDMKRLTITEHEAQVEAMVKDCEQVREALLRAINPDPPKDSLQFGGLIR